MEIHYLDLTERLSTIEDLPSFINEHGLGPCVKINVIGSYPPNSGQETMRNFFRALGYEFGDDEDVTITIYDSPIVE